MKHGFRQSMAWLHTWVGVVAGWVLFTIFLMGSATYYRAAITDWMQPERLMAEQAAAPSAQWRALERGVAQLMRLAPNADRWLIQLPARDEPGGSVSWQSPGAFFQTRPLDTEPTASTASALRPPRATEGGNFFYRFHYQLYFLGATLGQWVVGACAMIMLVALISGIVTHRRIFTDLFTFRPGKGIRSWLDAHNVTGVLALPYHLMITYTGLVTLMMTLMPWGIVTAYPERDGSAQFVTEAFDFAPPVKRQGGTVEALHDKAGDNITGAPFAAMLDDARHRLKTSAIGRVWIDIPGDAHATIKFTLGATTRVSMAPQSATYDVVSGKFIRASDPPGLAQEAAGVMYGIHEAEFAPTLLRIFYFLSGLSGAVMVGTGLVMWASKRRQKQTKHGRIGYGLRLVEHLNVATIAGLPGAMMAYLIANRLLASEWAPRADWEIRVFFIVWALAALYPFVRRPMRQAWVDLLRASAALSGLVPVVDIATIGHWLMPWLDATCATIGVMLLLIAQRIARSEGAPGKGARSKAAISEHKSRTHHPTKATTS